MNFETNRNSIIRFITTALAVINMVVITLGGDAINIADDKLYITASLIALVVTVAIAVYKHNATTPLGCLVRRIYDMAQAHGIEPIYETIVESLEAFADSEHEVIDEGDEE